MGGRDEEVEETITADRTTEWLPEVAYRSATRLEDNVWLSGLVLP